MIDMVSLSYALKALNGGGSEEIEKEIENLSLDVLDKAVLGFSIPKEMPIRNYIYPYNVGYPAYFMRVDRVDLGELDYTYDAERNAYVTEIPMCIETSSGPAVNVYLYGWESIEAHNGEWKRNTMAINTYGDGTSTFQDTFPQSIDPIYFKNSMKGSYLYFERYPYLLRIPEYDNVLSNFAKEYSPSKEYEPGEFCVFLNKTYMARVTTKGNTPYVSSSSTQWLMVDIASLIGAAYGMASLDENGRIPYSQLPESAMEFKGSWNAATNTPTLTQGSGINGDFYIVSTGGTWSGITFNANDRIIFDGSEDEWVRLPAGSITRAEYNALVGRVDDHDSDISGLQALVNEHDSDISVVKSRLDSHDYAIDGIVRDGMFVDSFIILQDERITESDWVTSTKYEGYPYMAVISVSIDSQYKPVSTWYADVVFGLDAVEIMAPIAETVDESSGYPSDGVAIYAKKIPEDPIKVEIIKLFKPLSIPSTMS